MTRSAPSTRRLFLAVLAAIVGVYFVGRIWLEGPAEQPAGKEAGILPGGPPGEGAIEDTGSGDPAAIEPPGE